MILGHCLLDMVRNYLQLAKADTKVVTVGLRRQIGSYAIFIVILLQQLGRYYRGRKDHFDKGHKQILPCLFSWYFLKSYTTSLMFRLEVYQRCPSHNRPLDQ